MAHTAQASVVTDQDTVPVIKVAAIEKGGVVRSAYGYLTLTAATAGQTNAFVRIPARARVVGIHPHMASMGNGSVKWGLYRTNDGIEVDSACFSAAMALTAKTGANVMDAVTPANLALDIASAFSTAVGTAGATSDAEFDVVANVVTVSTGAATAVGVEVRYVLPE